MGQNASNPEKVPDLGRALRWVREEQRLTQDEIADAVTEAGESLSKVYYGQIERGERYPSAKKLDAICASMDTDAERVHLVAVTRPWERMLSKKAPLGLSMDKARYRVRGDKLSPRASAKYDSRALADESEAMFEMQMHSLADLPAATSPAPPDTETAELLAIFQRLPRNDQLTILGMVRALGRQIT